MRRHFVLAAAIVTLIGLDSRCALAAPEVETGGKKAFQAGVAAVDVTPIKLPVLTSGGFLGRSGREIHDRLFARGIALDDGSTQIVMVVVDTLFVPSELCDQVKEAASRSTGVPTANMMISAIHTHSAGSLVGCLGTDTDQDYVRQVRPQLVACIERAVADLQPAQIGWASEIDAADTHCRVFIRRPDCIGVDPFGEKTIRVMMHPGYQNPEYLGPAGPVDNELSVLAVRTPEGRPLGLLANYSMHYFGAPAISADYFGDFVRILTDKLADGNPHFVAMMSNGTSGDQHWMDYSQPKRNVDRRQYAESVAAAAMRAYERIAYQDWVELGVACRSLRLARRVPDERRWAWAQEVLAGMEDPLPRNRTQVYAREAKLLRENPTCDLQLQAFRVGRLGIAAIPNEVYAISGLKLKLQCPLDDMFTVELANGCEGYIPPPEALPLGGYNSWPARTAGLQPDAETIIVDAVLSLFESLSGSPRVVVDLSKTPYARSVLSRHPLAYWRLGEIEGRIIRDYSGRGNRGVLQPGYALYLDGPDREDLRHEGRPAHAVQFVGGRMKAETVGVNEDYAVEFFFYNALPNDNRPVTGYLFSRGPDAAAQCPGDHFGIGGRWENGENQGRLFFFNGDRAGEVLAGGPVIEPKTWHHVRLERRGDRVRVYLDFGEKPIIDGQAAVTRPERCRTVFLGARSDKFAPLEGRIAEAAIFAVEPN